MSLLFLKFKKQESILRDGQVKIVWNHQQKPPNREIFVRNSAKDDPTNGLSFFEGRFLISLLILKGNLQPCLCVGS